MAANRNRLELTWIGKDERPRLEPRILLEDPELSYAAPHRVTENDIFDNRLIFGDNLLALKALEQEFAGKIQCVYIDPPFNTGQAFEHYVDGLEHSTWLTMMRDRLQLIHELLGQSGSLFVHIDDNELGYLIAITDEIFGRQNRVSVITFKQSSASGPKSINPGLVTTSSFVLYYAKDKSKWKSYRSFATTERDSRYNGYITNLDDDHSTWRIIGLREALARRLEIAPSKLRQTLGESLDDALTEFVLSDPARVIRLARVLPKDINSESRDALAESTRTQGRVYRVPRKGREDHYFLNGQQVLFYSAKARLIDGTYVTAEPVTTIWDDVLSSNLHNEGGVAFPNGKKPELLLKRATVHELMHGGKPWSYLLIPHDEIKASATLAGLAATFTHSAPPAAAAA